MHKSDDCIILRCLMQHTLLCGIRTMETLDARPAKSRKKAKQKKAKMSRSSSRFADFLLNGLCLRSYHTTTMVSSLTHFFFHPDHSTNAFCVFCVFCSPHLPNHWKMKTFNCFWLELNSGKWLHAMQYQLIISFTHLQATSNEK